MKPSKKATTPVTIALFAIVACLLGAAAIVGGVVLLAGFACGLIVGGVLVLLGASVLLLYDPDRKS